MNIRDDLTAFIQRTDPSLNGPAKQLGWDIAGHIINNWDDTTDEWDVVAIVEPFVSDEGEPPSAAAVAAAIVDELGLDD